MRRLRKLEGIVEELSGQIEIEKHSTTGNVGGGHSPDNAANIPSRDHSSKSGQAMYGGLKDSTTEPPQESSRSIASVPNSDFNSGRHRQRQESDSVVQDFGRLVLNENGKSRYVSSTFWSKMNDELDKLREDTNRLTCQDTEMSDEEETPSAVMDEPGLDDQSHQGFLLGYSSTNVDLRPLHPPASQIPFLWQVFQENVDPLVKILHIPTTDKMIRDMQEDTDSMTPAKEALMFSIYYAAITSMEGDEVQSTFNARKPALIKQYRFALEQALAKAQLFISPDMVVLQAFVLFLVLVRRDDDTRFSWMLTGLAIRIAYSMGLHRDGAHFPDLTPYEIEMRRRLWWSICILDLRSAEDQGMDLTILDGLSDTELPLNINDSDITPESKSLPEARDTHTDVTFSLIRYEVCVLARRLHTVTSTAATSQQDAALSLEMREKMLMETHDRVHEKYLKYVSTADNPMYWAAVTVARLIFAKLSLVIHQPVLFSAPGLEASEEIRDRLFVSCLEIVEYDLILHTEPRCKQWRWLYQTYTQCHAVAYLLFDICRRPWTPTVERAWTCIKAVFRYGPEVNPISGNPVALLPLRKLLLKAGRHRESEAARLRADPDEAERLRMSERVYVAPAKFGNLPPRVNNTMALLQWRELINPEGSVSTSEAAAGLSGPNRRDAQARASADTEGQASADLRFNIVNDVMENSFFNPIELIPFVFPSDDDPAYIQVKRELSLPGSQAAASEHFVGNNGQLTSTQAPSQPETGAEPRQNLNVSSQIGTPNINNTETNLSPDAPPWPWGDTWSDSIAEIAGSGEGDGDVNMDVDTFDWAGFQDTLGSFDLETGISTALKALVGKGADSQPVR